MKSTLKSPANRPLALGLFAITLTTAFVGGTDIAMAQSTRTPVRTPTHLATGEGGTNAGGGETTVRTVAGDPWNDGVVETLENFNYKAVTAYADGQNVRLAVRIYKAGLEEILSTATLDQHRLSWTYKMAARTLALAERMEAEGQVDAERDGRAILNVLQSSYDLISRYYYSLDVQFWIPYHLMCRGHLAPGSVTYDVTQFEAMLNHYTLSQVVWFKRQFVRTGPDGVVPQYSAKVFLEVLGSVARGLSVDLATDPNSPNPNLFPLAYSQTARSFKALADEVDQYLAGNGIYTNDERAVNGAYNRLERILNHISIKYPQNLEIWNHR